jgi:hypothetical protein
MARTPIPAYMLFATTVARSITTASPSTRCPRKPSAASVETAFFTRDDTTASATV